MATPTTTLGWGPSSSIPITNLSTHPNSTNTSTIVPATTFPRFTSLALELREQIWVAAFDNLPGRAILLSLGRKVFIEEERESVRAWYPYDFSLGHAINPEPEIIQTCMDAVHAYNNVYKMMRWTYLGETCHYVHGNMPSPNPDDTRFDRVTANLNKDIILFNSGCKDEEIVAVAEYLGPTICAETRHIGKIGGWSEATRGPAAQASLMATDLSFIYETFPSLESIALVRREGYFWNERKRVPRAFYTLVPSFAGHWRDGTTDVGKELLADGWKKYCNVNGKSELPCPSINFRRLAQSRAYP